MQLCVPTSRGRSTLCRRAGSRSWLCTAYNLRLPVAEWQKPFWVRPAERAYRRLPKGFRIEEPRLALPNPLRLILIDKNSNFHAVPCSSKHPFRESDLPPGMAVPLTSSIPQRQHLTILGPNSIETPIYCALCVWKAFHEIECLQWPSNYTQKMFLDYSLSHLMGAILALIECQNALLWHQDATRGARVVGGSIKGARERNKGLNDPTERLRLFDELASAQPNKSVIIRQIAAQRDESEDTIRKYLLRHGR